MSQYIQFFIRCEDKFVPCWLFSKYEVFYKNFDACGVPYGKIIPITEDILCTVETDLIDKEAECKANIRKERELIESIRQFNNTVDEKLEAIQSVNDTISDLEYEQRQIYICKCIINVFKEILSTAKYRDDGCPLANYTEDTVLYAGIEVPEYPTMDDLEISVTNKEINYV